MKTMIAILQLSILGAVSLDAKEFRAAPRNLAFLDQMMLPAVDFQGSSIEECRDFLWSRSISLDDAEMDPTKKGVMILIPQNLVPPAKHEGGITYRAENVSLSTVFKALARTAGLDLYNTSVGVVFFPQGRAPFPNELARKGKIWSTLYRVVPKVRERPESANKTQQDKPR